MAHSLTPEHTIRVNTTTPVLSLKHLHTLHRYRTMPESVELNDAIVHAAVCAANIGKDWVMARQILEEAMLGQRNRHAAR